MPTIEIAQETLEALRAKVRDFGDTPETVIRRLLAIDTKNGVASTQSGKAQQESLALKELVSSSRFQHLNSRGRYFEILKFLHNQYPDDFAKLLHLKFGKRVQIARSAEDIINSGKSTFPEPLADTGYWALTNLSNRSKRDVVFSAMRVLGCGTADIRLAVQNIPDTQPERSGSPLADL